MKINGLATIQVLDEIADIVLSVEFPKKEIEEYNLISTTVWVTYDLEGNYLQSEIADEGISCNLYLEEHELELIKSYIVENDLKAKMMDKIQK